jgi:membrane protein YqaA with SNARE-associated domain
MILQSGIWENSVDEIFKFLICYKKTQTGNVQGNLVMYGLGKWITEAENRCLTDLTDHLGKTSQDSLAEHLIWSGQSLEYSQILYGTKYVKFQQ